MQKNAYVWAVAIVATGAAVGAWSSATRAQPSFDQGSIDGHYGPDTRSTPCSDCTWTVDRVNPTGGQFHLVMTGSGVLGGVIVNAGDWIEFYDSDDPDVRLPEDYLGHYTGQNGPATSVDINVRFSKGLVVLVNATHNRPVLFKYEQD
ncbi:MAG: hypothetical protein GIKADHBN_01541 [Phycisphaerales bacterium]|nr:hypothetical protein [Phycisphaerales bacterium]MCK6475649.1 hypothetical protein [Phycisphaerales bacterium]